MQETEPSDIPLGSSHEPLTKLLGLSVRGPNEKFQIISSNANTDAPERVVNLGTQRQAHGQACFGCNVLEPPATYRTQYNVCTTQYTMPGRTAPTPQRRVNRFSGAEFVTSGRHEM